MLRWGISDSQLLFLKDEEEKVTYPSAKEIYAVEFQGNDKIGDYFVSKPSIDLNSLIFSKFPLDSNILMKIEENSESSQIKASIIFKKNNKVLKEIFSIDFLIDYQIINDAWYPLSKGSLDEIKNIFDKAQIKTLGPLTLKQYISLKKADDTFVIDQVQEIPMSKSGYISEASLPIPNFRGNLYPYQNQGFRWLKMIVEENAGCILADEMGLGKTPQIIAVLASEKSNQKPPSLVVAPLSLLENWYREIQKFAPQIKTKIHHGVERTGFFKEFYDYDLILTSYDTIFRDNVIFRMLEWNILIADEAQAIKNPIAKRTMAIKKIVRASTIAVTGTPIENRLTDLWSLSDFAFPGYLGSLSDFETNFTNDIESAGKLEPIISPIMLRRKVLDVAKDLPDRIDVPLPLRLSNKEGMQYEKLRNEIIEEYGQQASLVSIIKLRMFCTHPLLQETSLISDPAEFGKYNRLLEILEEIFSNKEKVIIFTSYKKMIDILINDLSSRYKLYCNYIDGRVDVSDRQKIIDEYSLIEDSAILVLNPKAAGSGLNITAANHVIHYNLEWNPAVEDQASARAHRRGQTRPVTIHRLYCVDTVEEAMNDRIETKRSLSESAVIGNNGQVDDSTAILKALLKSPLIKEE